MSSPVRDERLYLPAPQRAETPADLDVIQAPGTFTLRRSTALSPPAGFSSSVNEPNVGGQGQAIFMTWNWYAGVSADNGATFSYISPYSNFPTTPAPFGMGFCCDQRVAQDPSRDLVFWYLQYVKSEAAQSNGVRLAVAKGAAGLATNTWTRHDFTPADFGFALGHWLDFPHLQVSSNYLYFTSNVFTMADAFAGAVVGRIPLAALDGNAGYTMDTFVVTGSYGSIALVNGAKDTMYLASVSASNSLKVLRWPESALSPTVYDVVGLATTSGGTYACAGPDGLDPCTRANPRMQTGWITSSELGLMWTSSQDASHPYPYVRAVILDPAKLGQAPVPPSTTSPAVVSQPDIFSSTHAWLYPTVAVNARGHLGGVADALGGVLFPTIRALIRDDLSPDVTTSGWDTYPVAVSTNGTVGRWGDYNGAAAHEAFANTWLGVGHTQQGGSANASSRPWNFWFMRERDIPQTATVAFVAASSSVSEGAGTAVPNVTVTTSDGLPLAVPASVTYSTSDGSAQAGTDYAAVTGTVLTFAAGSPSGSVRAAAVAIIDDTLPESSETFVIGLSGPVGAVLGSPATHQVTIVDNDPIGGGSSTVGVWRPSEHIWYLRNQNTSGFNEVPAILYGADGDIPVTGDWNGDGVDTIGVYRPSEHAWYLRNSNTSGFNDVPAILYGAGADIPVAGDWNGDGIDTIGVHRPSEHAWYLRNSNTSGANDVPAILYGTTGDTPVMGDWNADGIDTIGVFRPAERVWYLRDSNTSGTNTVPAVLYGLSTDRPVVGSWDGR